jgi:hypothetical protein
VRVWRPHTSFCSTPGKNVAAKICFPRKTSKRQPTQDVALCALQTFKYLIFGILENLLISVFQKKKIKYKFLFLKMQLKRSRFLSCFDKWNELQIFVNDRQRQKLTQRMFLHLSPKKTSKGLGKNEVFHFFVSSPINES